MEGGETKIVIEVCSAIVASLCYCYVVSSSISKGKYRLISILPVLSLFTLIPLRLKYAFPTALATIFITWLANSKLLLFAFGLGPLSPNISLPLFITIACLPVTTKQNQTLLRQTNMPAEFIVFSVIVTLIDKYRDSLLHPLLLHFLYCLLIFLSLDILITASNSVVTMISGQLALEPPSDEPYFATSLQDFWGKRWNLVVSNILRHTVYRPVRSMVEPLIGKRLAIIVGVFMTFVVSAGLMHELALYYVTMERPLWELTGFFVLHGLCEVVEFFVKRAAERRRWRLHWAVSGPLTIGFVVVTGFWLFFPPLMRTGADVMVLRELKLFANFLKGRIESLVIKK